MMVSPSPLTFIAITVLGSGHETDGSSRTGGARLFSSVLLIRPTKRKRRHRFHQYISSEISHGESIEKKAEKEMITHVLRTQKSIYSALITKCGYPGSITVCMAD